MDMHSDIEIPSKDILSTEQNEFIKYCVEGWFEQYNDLMDEVQKTEERGLYNPGC